MGNGLARLTTTRRPGYDLAEELSGLPAQLIRFDNRPHRADHSRRAVKREWRSTIIAAGLEERAIPAARGGKWSSVQVSRLLEAAGVPFEAASLPSASNGRDDASHAAPDQLSIPAYADQGRWPERQDCSGRSVHHPHQGIATREEISWHNLPSDRLWSS